MITDRFDNSQRMKRQGSAGAAQPLRPLLLALLLVLSVQGQVLVPLITHWVGADHCDGAADCRPFGAGQDADGCDSPCSCLGCPAHVGPLALLNQLIDLGQPSEFRANHAPLELLSDLLLLRSVFRPPCA